MREDCRNSLLREWTYLNENLYPYGILIDELHIGGLVDEDRADIIREKPRREQVYLTLRNIIRRIDGPEILSKLLSILKKENSFIVEQLLNKSKQKAKAKQYGESIFSSYKIRIFKISVFIKRYNPLKYLYI